MNKWHEYFEGRLQAVLQALGIQVDHYHLYYPPPIDDLQVYKVVAVEFIDGDRHFGHRTLVHKYDVNREVVGDRLSQGCALDLVVERMPEREFIWQAVTMYKPATGFLTCYLQFRWKLFWQRLCGRGILWEIRLRHWTAKWRYRGNTRL